jgi:uncharacterized membrane protein
MNAESTTGLRPRVAAMLAYSGWWVTGALFWWIERRDAYVRFHAAQALVAFGTAAAVIAGFGVLAVASLGALPSAFSMFAWAAGAAWLGAVLLWVVAMWHAGRGVHWRIPIIGTLAERLAGAGTGAP